MLSEKHTKKNYRPRNCYLCNSENISFYGQINGFSHYKCNDCKLIWVGNEINSYQLEQFYNKDYFNNDTKIGYADYLAEENNHRKNAKEIINIVGEMKDLDHLRVLDIGCAYGFYIDEVRKVKNCDVYGVEQSEWARQFATEHLKLNIFDYGKLNSYFRSNFFDVVFLIGTIEHLIDPKNILTEIHRILKPKGLLVITTLDTNGIIPLFFLKPPEHLFYFDHNNLLLLLNRKGYKILLRKTYFSRYFLHEPFRILAAHPILRFFHFISKIIAKLFPNVSFKFPTNEMLVIAQKK